MKMNKKGFTLIEMLVVIAIIAVLVAIVIPVVGNSTKKAEAATDAANLRSAQASLSIAVMEMDKTNLKTYTDKGDKGCGADDYKTITKATTAPESKSDAGEFLFTVAESGEVTVYFGNSTISDFSAVADGTAETVPAKPEG